MSDLDFITTEDLLQEILNRADYGVISLMFENRMSGGEHLYITKWAGNSRTAMGLATDAIYSMAKQNEDEDTSIDTEDIP